jgi:hypothetical protein
VRRILPVTGIVVVLALAGASPASAATLCVNPGGTGGCFATIQGAVNAANPAGGDEIDVAAGTYVEPQVVVNKGVTISGAGIGQTILDGADATGLPAEGTLRVDSPADVTVQDMTVRRAGTSAGGTRTALYSGVPAAPTHTFDSIRIEGSGDPSGSDYGLYSLSSAANLVFTNGQIVNTDFNGVLLDRHTGPVDIGSNTIAPLSTASGSTVFLITHSNVNVTTPQRIHDNSLSVRGVTVHGAFNNMAGTGTFDDVEVTGNGFAGIASGAAVLLINGDTDAGGTQGVIANPRVNGNVMAGTDSGATRGIHMQGGVPGAQLLSNSISDFEIGLLTEPLGPNAQSGTVASFNRLASNTSAGVVNNTANPLGAENNWWGCNAGPGAVGCDSTVGTGPVDADPWLVLGLGVSPDPVAPNATSTATAALTSNSNGATVGGPFFTGPSAAFSATGGTMSPPTAPLAADGTAQSTYTAGSTPGTYEVSSTLDNQTQTVEIRVVQPPRPELDTTDAALGYAEDAGAVAIDPGITVIDPDTDLAGATVQISSNFASAQDELLFANQSGISGAYDDATGTLTLTGTASVADYQAALRSVSYENSSDAPSTATRTISFQARDTDSGLSNVATRDITLTVSNDPPSVGTNPGSVAYTRTGPSVAIDGALEVLDPDDTQFESAVVRLAGGFQPGDQLEFASQLGITGTYDSGTGVLTLAGSASTADYRTALRSVRYRYAGEADPAPAKTVEFRVSDGPLESAPATRTLDLTLLPGACANPRTGTGGDDEIFGTTAGDSIAGSAGIDRLFGFDGDDCLEGEGGNDRLFGGRGADRLWGYDDDDALYGQEDEDVLKGGRGNDKLKGGEAKDVFRGGDGDDRLSAADGVAEDVHCGRGRDRAVADEDDQVRACESVRRVP